MVAVFGCRPNYLATLAMLCLCTGMRLPQSDLELLAELTALGDGGFFCDRVVTPIFYNMSYEVGAYQCQGNARGW